MSRSRTMRKSSADTGVRRATGRDRHEWFALLDTWGAAGRRFREIAEWLTGEQGLTRWWAQKLIVEYEQERGLRPAGVRHGGTFSVTASKTVEVAVESLFAAFIDPKLRRRWLSGAKMRARTSQPGRSARFDWEDGATRVNVGFVAKGKTKSQVWLEHERLQDTKAAERAKAHWRQRLAALKELLERSTR